MGKVLGLASGWVSGVRKMRRQGALWFTAASSVLLGTRLGAWAAGPRLPRLSRGRAWLYLTHTRGPSKQSPEGWAQS